MFFFSVNSYSGDPLNTASFHLKDNSITKSKRELFIISVDAGFTHFNYDHVNKQTFGAEVFYAESRKFYIGAGIEYFKSAENTNIIAVTAYPLFADALMKNKLRFYATFAVGAYSWDKKVYLALCPYIRVNYRIGRYFETGLDFKYPLLYSGGTSSSPFLTTKWNISAVIW